MNPELFLGVQSQPFYIFLFCFLGSGILEYLAFGVRKRCYWYGLSAKQKLTRIGHAFSI